MNATGTQRKVKARHVTISAYSAAQCRYQHSINPCKNKLKTLWWTQSLTITECVGRGVTCGVPMSAIRWVCRYSSGLSISQEKSDT